MAKKKKKKKKTAMAAGGRKKAAKRTKAAGTEAKRKPATKKTAPPEKKKTPKKKPPKKKTAAKTKPAAKKKKAGKKKAKVGAGSQAAVALSRNAALHAEASTSSLFLKLRDQLRTIEIAGQKLWIAEGDTLLDEAELMVYARQREKANDAAQAASDADTGGLGMLPLGGGGGRPLTANTSGGKITQWKAGSTLTYRIVRSTFDRTSRYTTVVKNMKLATADWERTCGIRFEHKEPLDTKPGTGPGGATFAVQLDTSSAGWAALAFFPNAPVERRLLLVNQSYFSTQDYDRVGILRHELGHILGFRHEQIRSGAPPDCPQDVGPFTKQDLTKYDPTSVMHYFCGGVGSKELKISELDKQGAQLVYGPPLDEGGFV